MILTDAGPLVALISADDRNHAACIDALRAFREPMLTVWPAFTEAMYLLGTWPPAQEALWEFVSSGALSFAALDVADAPRMRALMRKYRDLPMDLADAAIVRVAEREGIRRVFTLDRRDFSVYRPLRTGKLEVVP
ncbi:MAG: PIN domain-containing protein [Acidobacteria bacterium]|nr:PIN domain-containing protein [Acidobacteriota bacterium]